MWPFRVNWRREQARSPNLPHHAPGRLEGRPLSRQHIARWSERRSGARCQ